MPTLLCSSVPHVLTSNSHKLMICMEKFDFSAGDDLNVEILIWHPWQLSTAGGCNASSKLVFAQIMAHLPLTDHLRSCAILRQHGRQAGAGSAGRRRIPVAGRSRARFCVLRAICLSAFFSRTATRRPPRGRFKSLTDQQRRWLKRKQAIEPAIGHTSRHARGNADGWGGEVNFAGPTN